MTEDRCGDLRQDISVNLCEVVNYEKVTLKMFIAPQSHIGFTV